MAWVPVDMAAATHLPRGERPYTELEALFALQADYALGRGATIAAYAAQWRWTRDRVREWLGRIGVQIVGQVGRRPGTIQPATGQQPVSNRSVTGHLRFHDFGRIGREDRQQPVSNPPATGQQPVSPNTDTDIDTYMPPPTPSTAAGGGDGDVEEYIRLAGADYCRSQGLGPDRRPGVAVSIRRRLQEQGGLREEDRLQLEALRQQAREVEAMRERQAQLLAEDDELAPQRRAEVVPMRERQSPRENHITATWGEYLALPSEQRQILLGRFSSEQGVEEVDLHNPALAAWFRVWLAAQAGAAGLSLARGEAK